MLADLELQALSCNFIVGIITGEEPIVYQSAEHRAALPPVKTVGLSFCWQIARRLTTDVALVLCHHIECDSAGGVFDSI